MGLPAAQVLQNEARLSRGFWSFCQRPPRARRADRTGSPAAAGPMCVFPEEFGIFRSILCAPRDHPTSSHADFHREVSFSRVFRGFRLGRGGEPVACRAVAPTRGTEVREARKSEKQAIFSAFLPIASSPSARLHGALRRGCDPTGSTPRPNSSRFSRVFCSIWTTEPVRWPFTAQRVKGLIGLVAACAVALPRDRPPGSGSRVAGHAQPGPNNESRGEN